MKKDLKKKILSMSNINMTNSGEDTIVDAPTLRDFSGIRKVKGNIQMNTPIQPVYKRDPRYIPERKQKGGKGYSNRKLV
jgi:hypothetical protein